jgi:5'-nucleotidase
MRILLDMDGPLADFDAAVFALATLTDVDLDIAGPHEQTARYFTDHVVSKTEKKLIQARIKRPGWFRALPVTAGAVDGVAALLEAGHDLWVATKPMESNPTCRDEKAAWLREHFPMLERRMFIAPNKSLLHADVLLDDAPKLSWIEQASWRPVIFKAPFNGRGSKWGHIPQWSWGDPIEWLGFA